MKIPLGGSASDMHSRRLREVAINCFRENNANDEFRRIARAPLFDDFTTIGTGGIRGFCVAAGAVYAVAGNQMYKITTTAIGAAVTTLLGNVTGTNGLISMAAIGTDQPQVMAVCNGSGFIYDDSTGVLSQVTDVDFTPDVSVVSFGQRFYLTKPDSNEFFCSGIYPNGAVFDPLDFASAEVYPDLNVAITATDTTVVVFGETSVQTFQDAGIPVGFPLIPMQGGAYQRGCASALSVVTAENTIFWLADDFTIRMLRGHSMSKISDLAFDEEVLTYTHPESAFAMYIDYPYYKCYVITFPTNNVTWCYDVVRGFWHKRASVGYNGWRVQTACLYRNMTILGDKNEGRLFKMNADSYTEAGNSVIVVIRTPPVFSDDVSSIASRLELVCDTGVGLIGNVDSLGVTQDQPIAPMITMKISRDGGANWTNYTPRTLGRIGQYVTKVIWRQLGFIPRSSEMVFEFHVVDAVQFNAYSLNLDMEAGIV